MQPEKPKPKTLDNDHNNSVVVGNLDDSLPAVNLSTPAKKPRRFKKWWIAIIVICLYFSGILGFGFYTIKCGGIPATYTNFAAADSETYFGDPVYFIDMPFTSIGWDQYRCTNKSPFPWVRASQAAADKQAKNAEDKRLREEAIKSIDFDVYVLRHGSVPNIIMSGWPTIDHKGILTTYYTDTKNKDSFYVLQRSKTSTVADDPLCERAAKQKPTDPDYDPHDNFCGDFTPKGIRVYHASHLVDVTEEQSHLDVFEVGETQILFEPPDFFVYHKLPNGNKVGELDTARFLKFVDSFSKLTYQEKATLLKNTRY